MPDEGVAGERRAAYVRVRCPSLISGLGAIRLRSRTVSAAAAAVAFARVDLPLEIARWPTLLYTPLMRRRVDLAAALATGATVLIIDELLRGLSSFDARSLLRTLQKLARMEIASYIIGDDNIALIVTGFGWRGIDSAMPLS